MAATALAWMCWAGGGTLERLDAELAWQPSAAPVLTGLSDETLDKPTLRAERAERRRARKEAARAKRAAARERRSEAAEARREASRSKREAARERRAAAKLAKREASEARRAAKLAKREAAREERDAAREERERSESLRESSAFAAANAAPRTPSHMGILRINSLPWAQVFIDGRMVGYTPQRGISLTPGDHAVRLINPEFAMSKTVQVRITKGKAITRSEVLEE